MNSSTLFAPSTSATHRFGKLLIQQPRIDLLPDGRSGPRRFKIKSVQTDERQRLIDGLLERRYRWRGYKAVKLPTDPSASSFTLAAVDGQAILGTLTVSFDGPRQLGAAGVFAHEVATLQHARRRICEFTKLAIDPTIGCKRVLAALFHMAYIVAHRIRGYDTLLIEVNPRHVVYYERMLGFKALSEPRVNRAVQAPAVLMSLDFSHAMAKIGEFGGRLERLSTERSLYPACFTLQEEAGIIVRMRARHDAQ